MRRARVQHRLAPLAIALGASLALHGLILASSVMVAIGRVDAERVAAVSPPPPETLIGLEESSATTVDWIGFAEYEEHRAPLSETNQAAFSESPSDPAPPSEETAVAEAAPAPADEAGDEAEAETAEAVMSEQPLTDGLPLGGISEVTEAEAEAADETAAAELAEMITAARSWALAALQSMRPRGPARNTPELNHPRLQSNNPSEASAPAVPPSQPSRAAIGERSDKESDPASTIDVTKDQWVLGKPLAAHGGELYPHRMEVTPLTRVTAWVHDAIVAITIDHRGIVVAVELLQSSGHSQVDKNMVDSLYGWRAAGGRFAELQQGETITIELRYVLSRR